MEDPMRIKASNQQPPEQRRVPEINYRRTCYAGNGNAGPNRWAILLVARARLPDNRLK